MELEFVAELLFFFLFVFLSDGFLGFTGEEVGDDLIDFSTDFSNLFFEVVFVVLDYLFDNWVVLFEEVC
jgi:hypothetical protein